MWYLVGTVLVLGLGIIETLLENDFMGDNEIKLEHYVFWPNATIPFYIDADHFDHEQSNVILTALTMFAFKTCLKFLPALVKPTGDQHVLVLHNPNGVRQCVFSTTGHARDEPHKMVIGYDCLKSPKIDMMLMKALGFGFEHNRAIRDLYVAVQKENVDPSAMDLFTMDDKLPVELRALPYDVHSAMHFDERDFSKNGHKTIIILDHRVKQNRVGLSDIDVRKINTVYGPECRKRDRQEKIDLCQGFPGVARRKRDTNELTRRKRDLEASERKSLRVNPDITPPSSDIANASAELALETDKNKKLHKIIDEYDLKNSVEEVINLVFKVGARALTNIRHKYCNTTEKAAPEEPVDLSRRNEEEVPDIIDVAEKVTLYVKGMIDHAVSNLTAFCEGDNNFRAYLRASCPFFTSGGGGGSCNMVYKSTKHGPVMYSTQHRPWIVQSTKHVGGRFKNIQYHQSGRRENAEPSERRKRAVEDREKREAPAGVPEKSPERRFKGRRYNVLKAPALWEDSDVTLEDTKRNMGNQERGKELVGRKHRQSLGKRFGDPKRSSKGHIPKTVALTKKNKEFYGERRWPLGIVRYVITKDETFNLDDLRERLEAVNRILKERTCARIEEISEEEATQYDDYLVLDASADYITGRVGGRQNFGSLELFEGGQHKQHAAMMVMAMLGFYFELARHDRDAHVRVHMRHVRADKLHHFEKIRSDATLPLPYDYESATHPAWQFWRKIGKTGISTVATYKEKDPDGSIMRALGQHDQLLSELDIVKINTIYGVKCFMEKNQKSAEEKHKPKDKEENKHRDRDTEDRELEKNIYPDRYKIKDDQDSEEGTNDGRLVRDKNREHERDVEDERGDGRHGRHRDKERNDGRPGKHRDEDRDDGRPGRHRDDQNRLREEKDVVRPSRHRDEENENRRPGKHRGEERYDGRPGKHREEERDDGTPGRHRDEERVDERPGRHRDDHNRLRDDRDDVRPGRHRDEEYDSGRPGKHRDEERDDGRPGRHRDEERDDGRPGRHRDEERDDGRPGRHRDEERDDGRPGRHRDEERDDGRPGRHREEERDDGRPERHREENRDDGRPGRHREEERDDGRHRKDKDRHRNKREQDKNEGIDEYDDETNKSRLKHKDYDLDQDREDQESIRDKNREENEYGRGHKNKERIEEDGNHRDETQRELEDERQRHKIREESYKKMEQKKLEGGQAREEYGKNKHEEGMPSDREEYGPNRYKIKERETDAREKDRDRHNIREEKGREYANEDDRLRKELEEEENRNRHRHKEEINHDGEREREMGEGEEQDFRGSNPNLGREMQETVIKWPDQDYQG